MPVDRQQLPKDANVLQQMVLDLVAQLDTEQSRRIKVERLLRQLLEARSGRKSEQISDDQLALFAAELKAQGVDIGEAASEGKQPDGPDDAPPAPPVQQEKGKPHGRRPLSADLKRERIDTIWRKPKSIAEPARKSFDLSVKSRASATNIFRLK